MKQNNALTAGIFFTFGVLVTGLAINFISEPIPKEYLTKIRTFNYENVKYNVTIDSSATDSLFGKTWRK